MGFGIGEPNNKHKTKKKNKIKRKGGKRPRDWPCCNSTRAYSSYGSRLFFFLRGGGGSSWFAGGSRRVLVSCTSDNKPSQPRVSSGWCRWLRGTKESKRSSRQSRSVVLAFNSRFLPPHLILCNHRSFLYRAVSSYPDCTSFFLFLICSTWSSRCFSHTLKQKINKKNINRCVKSSSGLPLCGGDAPVNNNATSARSSIYTGQRLFHSIQETRGTNVQETNKKKMRKREHILCWRLYVFLIRI